MESDTDDGHSSASRPLSDYTANESIEITKVEPVRFEVQEDSRRSVITEDVKEIPNSSHPKRSSSLKTCCLICMVIVSIIGILLIVTFIVLFIIEYRKKMAEAAHTLHRYIDYDVDPCDDFYKFSCGKFIEKYEPDIKDIVEQFDFITEDIDDKKQALLEEPVKDNELPIIKKTKNFYRVCTDIDSINKRGVEPLKDLLLNDLGGWPLTYGEWKESNFDLVTTLVKVKLLGLAPILKLKVFIDSKDNRKTRLMIDQPNFVIRDRNVYLDNRNNIQLKAYEELITDIATVLGLPNKPRAAEEVKALVDFEIKLIKISRSLELQLESYKIYNAMTLEDVQGNYSQIMNWTRYVHTLMSLPEVNIDISNEEIIMNQAPHYYEKLAEVINKTPNRTMANYIIWTVVYDSVNSGMVGTVLKKQMEKYREAVPGGNLDQDRKSFCVSSTTDVFPLPVGRMFVEKYFDPEAKIIATDMVNELKKAFSELLKESDWLDEQTKKYAEEKKQNMITKIAYPDYIYNNTYMEKIYSGVNVGTNYFENVISSARYDAVNSLLDLRQPYDTDEWDDPATEINAYYATSVNEIVIPAGILQKPFFDKTFPKSMNYGGMGSFIGHEITHGFDDLGRHYNKDGNLHDWWSNAAKEKFKNKSQCMIDQYGSFILEPSKIKANGIQTLDENIADNGGLKEAFRAYRNWVKSRGKEEEPLSGFKFNHNQIFFISFAQLWCRVKVNEMAQLIVNTDTHSPYQLRVKGSVQNSEDFAKAFNCPVDSMMNPSKKCQIW